MLSNEQICEQVGGVWNLSTDQASFIKHETNITAQINVMIKILFFREIWDRSL